MVISMRYIKKYRFSRLLLVVMIIIMGWPWSCYGQLPPKGVWKAESKETKDLGSTGNQVVASPGKSGLAAKLANVGQRDQLVVLPPGTWAVEANLVVPHNVTLRVDPGALLHVADGVTLTVQGPLEAGIRQIFQCAGTGKVLCNGSSVREVYPQWWGAKADGTERVVTTQAFQAAINAHSRIFVPAGTYLVNNLLPRPRITMYGPSPGRTTLIGVDQVFYVRDSAGAQEVCLRNLTLKVESNSGWAIRKEDAASYLDSWEIDHCWFLQSGQGSISCNAIHWNIKDSYFGHGGTQDTTGYKTAIRFGDPNPAGNIAPNANKFDQCIFVGTREQAVCFYAGEGNKFIGCIMEVNGGRAVELHGSKATAFYSCHFEGNNKSSYDSEILLAVHGSGVGGLPLSTLLVGCYFSPSPTTKFVVRGEYPATFIDCCKAGGWLIWHAQELRLGDRAYTSGIINLSGFFSNPVTIRGHNSEDYNYTPFQIETEQDNHKTDYKIRQYQGTTTNDTPINIGVIPLKDNNVYLLEARVLASKPASSNNSPAQVAAYVRRATVMVQNNQAILIGKVQESYSAAANPGWMCTMHLYADYAYIRVTGANDSTINWQTTLIMQGAPQ
jgi:hypothetical protein